jgi:PPK2 family polyphosphate:nucleotide phosphotransferase
MKKYLVKPGEPLDLESHDPRDKSSFDGTKKEGKALLGELNRRLEELQELLYAQGKHKVLVVLQAMDCGGKDGTIRHVFDGVNPQGVKVARFVRPTPRELSQDYLWRVHQHTPRSGHITIFNRSHYEDVLIVRVHGLVPEERWRRRYDHIVGFEKLLADEGTTIVKLFLNISKEEQAERLQARLDEPHKNWKFDIGDIAERQRWDQYRAAYREALEQTSKPWAPWYVIPGDRKWYRNVVISRILIGVLEGLEMSFPEPAEGLDSVVIE